MASGETIITFTPLGFQRDNGTRCGLEFIDGQPAVYTKPALNNRFTQILRLPFWYDSSLNNFKWRVWLQSPTSGNCYVTFQLNYGENAITSAQQLVVLTADTLAVSHWTTHNMSGHTTPGVPAMTGRFRFLRPANSSPDDIDDAVYFMGWEIAQA